MRKSLIIISIFLTFTVSASSQNPVTEYYRNGKIKISSFIKNDTYDSTYILYFENGNIKKTGNFKSTNYRANRKILIQEYCGFGRDTTEPKEGVKNGEWKNFYENGKIKSVNNYLGGILIGQSNLFDTIGRLRENEFYNAGNLIQKQEYSESGILIKFITRTLQELKNKGENSYSTTYFDKVFEYYSTGELKSIRVFNEEEQLTGAFVEYWKNGIIKNEGEYKSGSKNGIFREYYENGNTKFEGIFKNGEPDGYQYFSNENGKNSKIEIWKNGKLTKTQIKSSS